MYFGIATSQIRLTLHFQLSQYSFDGVEVEGQWPRPQATVFHGMSNMISPSNFHDGSGYHSMTDGVAGGRIATCRTRPSIAISASQ